MSEIEPLLQITDLRVRFDGADEDAVSAVTLEVTPGEILAVVGESGSGKSVTALSVLGLLPTSAAVSGSVRFDGRELVDAVPAELNRVRGSRIAIIFQDPSSALDPVFTVGHQLNAVLARHRGELSRQDRSRVAVELLSTVGVPDPTRRLRDYPHQFSGGQLQRIMIAMSLAADPALLLADEPTTALDVTVQQEILDLLRQLNQELGTAVLLITHDMGVVADLAHRVVVMRHGRVVEQAPVEQLFAAASTAYTRALLDAVPTGEESADAVPSDAAVVLDVSGLSVNYRTAFTHTPDVVSGVSFRIREGEVLGLVGESGSGKSSIGKSLLGLAPRSAGIITFSGDDLSALSRTALRARRAEIGMVFQSPSGSLNPRLTVGESVAEPLRHAGLSRGRGLQVRVDELIDQVGLPTNWHSRYPHELSGGQKQRVAIARALALSPRLLIADEPTSALDVSVQADILRLLKNLQEERAFACLFISHDLHVVQSLCQNVIVLRHGRIVEAGPTATVLRAPREEYTQRLVRSAPIPDPAAQARRRAAA